MKRIRERSFEGAQYQKKKKEKEKHRLQATYCLSHDNKTFTFPQMERIPLAQDTNIGIKGSRSGGPSTWEQLKV